MTTQKSRPRIPIPQGRPRRVKSAMLHVIALAQYAMAYACGWAVDSRIARVRLKGRNDQLKQHVALLEEEIRIRDARIKRIAPNKRLHYSPTERLAILEVRMYTSLIRHWLSSRMAMYFLAAQTQQFRGEKSADHAGAGGRRGQHLGHRTVETPAPLADPRCRVPPLLSGSQ